MAHIDGAISAATIHDDVDSDEINSSAVALRDPSSSQRDADALLRNTRKLSIQSSDMENTSAEITATSSPQKPMAYPKSRRLTNLKSFDVHREMPTETGTNCERTTKRCSVQTNQIKHNLISSIVLIYSTYMYGCACAFCILHRSFILPFIAFLVAQHSKLALEWTVLIALCE